MELIRVSWAITTNFQLNPINKHLPYPDRNQVSLNPNQQQDSPAHDLKSHHHNIHHAMNRQEEEEDEQQQSTPANNNDDTLLTFQFPRIDFSWSPRHSRYFVFLFSPTCQLSIPTILTWSLAVFHFVVHNLLWPYERKEMPWRSSKCWYN